MATIVGLFEHTNEVDRAIDELTKEGFAKNQIGIVARHDTVKQMGLTTVSGAEVGAITGATTGGIAGLLIGLGALLIPGLAYCGGGHLPRRGRRSDPRPGRRRASRVVWWGRSRASALRRPRRNATPLG